MMTINEIRQKHRTEIWEVHFNVITSSSSNFVFVRKLLGEASAAPTAPPAEQPANAPKGPVLIELDDEPEASPGEAQKV